MFDLAYIIQLLKIKNLQCMIIFPDLAQQINDLSQICVEEW